MSARIKARLKELLAQEKGAVVREWGASFPIALADPQRRLADFGAVAFSISFEVDYPYVLQILAGAGIPLRAADRGPEHPLVLAGGVATFLNPEPLAPFVDAFFLGEGEAGAVPFFQFLAEAHPSRARRGRGAGT